MRPPRCLAFPLPKVHRRLPAETTDEMLLMGLRLTEGVDLDRLARQGGMRPTAAAIAELTELGLTPAINTIQAPYSL